MRLEALLIVVLGAVVAWLWSQLKALRASQGALEERLHALEWRLHEAGQPDRHERTRPTAPADAPTDVTRSQPAAVDPTAPADPVADEPREAAPPSPEIGYDEPDTRGGLDFEELFGRRLPIWAGGITLAIGGIFLVRLAIESGLMTPPVRVAASFAFGIALLMAAELAHRIEARLADPRVRQALAGAGLATLYAAFYLAGSVYALIGAGAAFGGLALVTALALGLAFRFGLPTALLGLVGGFATPAMISSEDPNLPLLTFYLALLAAGIAYTGQRMGAAWLGLVALLGGFGWGALVLSAMPVATRDFVATGLYLVVLGAAVPVIALRGSQSASWSYTAAAALASIQLAMLLALNEFSLLAWGLYLLLLIALAVLGWREPAIRRGSGFAAALALLMLAWWDAPARDFVVIATGIAVLTAAIPIALARLRRAGEEDRWQAIAVPPALAVVAIWQFHEGQGAQVLLAMGIVALGALAVAAAAIGRTVARSERHEWGHGAAIALIVYLALLTLVPNTAIVWSLAVAASVCLFALPRWHHAALAILGIAAGWAIPTIAAWSSALAPAFVGMPAAASELPLPTMLANRLLPVALLTALLSWRLDGRLRELRLITAGSAIALAVIIAHIAYRQLFPLSDPQAFAAQGLLERTGWQALLLAAGFALVAVGSARAASWAVWTGRALVALSLAHFVVFGLVLHNPLWDAQAVGPWPLANLLLPSYALGAIAAWLAGREIERAGFARGRLASDVVLMALALGFVLSTLRQAFAGSVLVASPMGASEDLLRSLLGIVVALAFLAWGWWRKQRRWRVGSLVLMLGAVAKVFLIDAAGLDGLLRVASFLALGFSLIGIGWIYSRLLRSDTSEAPAQA
ncbi:MAG: hypothetical protein CL801_09300 [Citromicrobium sp.]|mgnify:CR=1 FL=1|nr:hypothetical protein [Citromicrobium sp.]